MIKKEWATKPCPYCTSLRFDWLHGEKETDDTWWDTFAVYCMHCDTAGPSAESKELAVKRWNSLPR